MVELISVAQKASIYQKGKPAKFLFRLGKPLAIRLGGYIYKYLEEPTKENTWRPNSHLLIDLRDEFFEHNFHPADDRHCQSYRGWWNFFIAIYDFDAFYTERLDWLVWRIKQLPWVVLSGEERPRPTWWLNDDRKFGEYDKVDTGN